MSEQEFSASGNPIYTYNDVKPKEFTPAIGDGDSIEAISAHIEKYVGPVDFVFHEIISDLVHIDIHWVKPSAEFPFHFLCTSGMSDLPMNTPNDEVGKYAELCVLLPSDWKLETEPGAPQAFDDEKNYWPLRWMKIIARFPHEYDTWMGYGHTLPNGENADPFADNTKLGCMLLLPSITLDKAFFELKINEEKTINFYSLFPIYKEEMKLKLDKGSDALLDKFEEFNVSEVIDINRENSCKKKGFLGLW